MRASTIDPALAPLTHAFVAFEAQVEQLAREIATSILRTELHRRRARQPAARPAPSRKRRTAAAAVAVAPRPVAPPPAPPGRAPTWTRDTIVAELSRFFANKTELDAAFITRHGPRGLVAAARRIFGRFDAALNVAALHWSKQQAETEADGSATVS